MKKGVQRLIDIGNNHLSIWSSQLDDECGNQMIVSEIFSAAIHNEEVENTQIAHIFMIEALQID